MEGKGRMTAMRHHHSSWTLAPPAQEQPPEHSLMDKRAVQIKSSTYSWGSASVGGWTSMSISPLTPAVSPGSGRARCDSCSHSRATNRLSTYDTVNRSHQASCCSREKQEGATLHRSAEVSRAAALSASLITYEGTESVYRLPACLDRTQAVLPLIALRSPSNGTRSSNHPVALVSTFMCDQ